MKLSGYIFVCLSLCGGLSWAQDSTGNSLTINVTGAKPNVGDAIFSLFTKDNYLSEPLLNKTAPISANGDAQWIIEDLSSGTYAVSVIYDENRDGKLNTGLFKIPTEKIGMSNNAKGRFGPPSFKKSSFVFSASTTLEISFSKAKD